MVTKARMNIEQGLLCAVRLSSPVRDKVCSLAAEVEPLRAIFVLCFWSVVCSWWDWSSSTGRRATEPSSEEEPLSSSSPLNVLFCPPSHVVRLTRYTVVCPALDLVAALGMLIISPGIPQALLSKSHQCKPREVRSYDWTRTCCGSFGGGSAQPKAALARPAPTTPTAGAPTVHSDVLEALNLQSLPREAPAKGAARIVLPKPVEAGADSQRTGCDDGITPPCRCLLTVELCSCGRPRASLTSTSGWCSTTLQSLQLSAQSQQLPESVPWTLSPVTKPLPMPADAHLRLETRLVARTLCRGPPLFHLSQSMCSPLILWYFFSAWSSHQWGGFPGCKLFFFASSLPGARVSSHFHFRFFPIVPPSYIETFPVLSGMWGLLLIFSTCSVRIVLFEDVSLIYLWEKVSSLSCYSTILVGSPPWAVFKNQIYFQKTKIQFPLAAKME